MKFVIELDPVRPISMEGTPVPILDKEGSSLWINGEELDFSFMEDGDELEPGAVEGFNAQYFIKNIRRQGDIMFIPLVLPHGPDACEEVRFPEAIVVEEDGSITLPCDSEIEETESPFDITIPVEPEPVEPEPVIEPEPLPEPVLNPPGWVEPEQGEEEPENAA